MKDAWIVYSKFIMDKKNKNGDKDLVINEAKEKYNLDIDLVCAHDFYVACDERGNKLYYKGKLLNEIPKYIVFRKYDIYLARQFELMGSVVMNSSQSMVDARNKMKTYQILAKNNIRIPKTLYIVCGVSRKYFKSEFDINDIDIHKLEILCPDDESMDLCIDIIKTNPECDYFSSVNKKAIEIYLKKNTKGSAILKIAEHLDIKIENTYAFGDGKNDIEMLSTVGCGIAMGNANDEVKKYADEITESVHNDGVAVGIKKYIYKNI